MRNTNDVEDSSHETNLHGQDEEVIVKSSDASDHQTSGLEHNSRREDRCRDMQSRCTIISINYGMCTDDWEVSIGYGILRARWEIGGGARSLDGYRLNIGHTDSR